MINRVYHEEIGGGYTGKRKIILDAADLRSVGGKFEVAAIYEDGEELEIVTVADEADVKASFEKMVQKYAGEFQKALYAANLVPGRKYTLVMLNDFGFPATLKITFDGLHLTTYAQHSDAVKMAFRLYRKRDRRIQNFYNCSLLIFDGWQDMDESVIKRILVDTEGLKITQSKYSCFSANYIEDLERAFKNPVLIYKNYKTGVNGKVYA